MVGATASSFVLAPPTSIAAAAPRNKLDVPRPLSALTAPLRGGSQSRGLTRVKATVAEAEETPKQTIATATFNLIKGCVGAGVLSLPAGVAAIGDVPNA